MPSKNKKIFKPLITKKDRIFNFDEPATVVLLSFLIVVLLARFISYLVIQTNDLPEWLFVTVYGFRLHHFVYGNAILGWLGFAKFVLELKIPKRITALIYGIGLGLVIDEFSLWSGGLTYLLPNNVYVINTVNLGAVIVVALAIFLVIYMKHRRRQKKLDTQNIKINPA